MSLYIFITHRTFGVLPNLSISYYHYERKHKYFGLMFPALMVLLCGTLLPIWIYDTATGSAWAQHFVCLPCIALLCLLVVACTGGRHLYAHLTKLHPVVAGRGGFLLHSVYLIS